MAELVLLIPIALLLAVSFPLVATDFKEHRLPNQYTYPLIAVTALTLLGYGLYSGESAKLAASLLAMSATFLIGWLLARFADLGMGDVKLLIPLNGWLAWHDGWLVLISLALAMLTANVFAIAIWIKKKDPREHIALGPFLLLGFYLTAFLPTSRIFTAVGESLA
jgi:prepilin signal peptidase PulO-like enzyme (type II secretory pathway)